MRARAGALAGTAAQRFPLTADAWRATSQSKQRAVMAGCACWCLALVAFLYSVASVLFEEECIDMLPYDVCSQPASIEFSSDVKPAVDIVFIDDRSTSMAPPPLYMSFFLPLILQLFDEETYSNGAGSVRGSQRRKLRRVHFYLGVQLKCTRRSLASHRGQLCRRLPHQRWFVLIRRHSRCIHSLSPCCIIMAWGGLPVHGGAYAGGSEGD